MLLVVPIVPSRISQHFHPLFLCHYLLFVYYSLNLYCVSDNDVMIHIVANKRIHLG